MAACIHIVCLPHRIFVYSCDWLYILYWRSILSFLFAIFIKIISSYPFDWTVGESVHVDYVTTGAQLLRRWIMGPSMILMNTFTPTTFKWTVPAHFMANVMWAFIQPYGLRLDRVKWHSSNKNQQMHANKVCWPNAGIWRRPECETRIAVESLKGFIAIWLMGILDRRLESFAIFDDSFRFYVERM